MSLTTSPTLSAASADSSVTSIYEEDDVAYKMDSFGTIPTVMPSREEPLQEPSKSKTNEGEGEEEESEHSLPFLQSPRSKTSSLSPHSIKGARVANVNSNASNTLQNSNVSLDIIVEARTDEPPSRHDVYYASTETFPTSNVVHNSGSNRCTVKNRRDIMANASANMVPTSNISSSQLTALLSVGDTTPSDLTTATGSSFGTANAVILPVTGREDYHHSDPPIEPVVPSTSTDDADGALLHIMSDKDSLPLEEVLAKAQSHESNSSLQQNHNEGNPQEVPYHSEREEHQHPRYLNVSLESDPTAAIAPTTSSVDPPNRSISYLHNVENPPVPPTESKSRGTPSWCTTSSDGVALASSRSGKTAEDHTTEGGASSLSCPGTMGTKTRKDESLDALLPSTAKLEATQETDRTDPPFDHKYHFKQEAFSSPRPYTKYACRTLVIVLVLLVVVLSTSLFYTRERQNDVNTGTGSAVIPSVAFTPAPSFLGTTITNGPRSSFPTLSPSSLPSPTAKPSTAIVPQPSDSFEEVAGFLGQSDGDRFGTVVAMSSSGDFVAALSLDPVSPVRTFLLRETAGWQPLSNVPIETSVVNIFASTMETTKDLSVATTVEGFPVVAVSTESGIQVFEHHSSSWVERGQVIQWSSISDSDRLPATASSTAICVSNDASLLAAGYATESGRALEVLVLAYDSGAKRWVQRGDSIVLTRTEELPPFLSLSLAFAGDGEVVAVAGWGIGNPQVVLDTYEWREQKWRAMGGSMSLPWGPAYIALSQSGNRLAQVNIAVGSAYEWNGSQWIELGGEFVGGTSVSLSSDGGRVMVGDALQGMATVLDFEENQWQLTTSIRGAYLSRFGESVAMDHSGSTLSIGSPYADGDGSDNGQITLFH